MGDKNNLGKFLDLAVAKSLQSTRTVTDDADDDADDDACLFMRSPITVYAAAVGGQMIQHRHRQPLQLVSDDR